MRKALVLVSLLLLASSLPATTVKGKASPNNQPLWVGDAQQDPSEGAPQVGPGFVAKSHTRVRKHRKRQKRPIKLGISGGNILDSTFFFGLQFCCSGTLGALVEKNGTLYVLSNNHVLARVNRGEVGEPISHNSRGDSIGKSKQDRTRFCCGSNVD